MTRNRTNATHRNPLMAIIVAVVGLIGLMSMPSAARAAEEAGWARFGHFAPSASAVDVFVDGQPFAQGINFKTVSAYSSLPPGVHVFEVKPAGEPDGDAVVRVEANVPPAGAITIGAVTTRDGVSPQVFDDALVVPEPGQSLVRFIHAAPDSAAVDIAVEGGATLAANVPYPQATAYAPIEPAAYDVVITDSDSGDTLLRVAGWSINPGEQSTIVVLRGSDGALDVAPIVDAVAVAVAPMGGVQTGYGSMAGSLDGDGGLPVGPIALAGVAVAAGALMISRRRQQV